MVEKTDVRWDLSDLFQGVDDPNIDKTLDDCLADAKLFAEKYRGKIESDDLTAQVLYDSLKEYEALYQKMAKPAYYASMVFAADTSNPEHGALMQHVQERETEAVMYLMFFELELMAAKSEVISSVLQDDLLKDYRHYVESLRLFSPYRLSEPEEKILQEKANTGSRAFDRLFDESISAIEFYIELEGEKKTLTEPEVLALLRDPDRETRRKAAASLTDGLTRHGRLLTFVFNTLVYDKAVDDRLRGYEYPEQARHLSNELDRETVETMTQICVDNFPLVARYYRTKREILGYDKLTHYDRYAPLFEQKEEVSFEDAKNTVLTSFSTFSKVIGDAAQDFFTNNWVDAEPRSGKRGGAFCMGVTPDLHPYVFVNFLNRKDDVRTLAHEMGHGVHYYLAGVNNYLNYGSVLPIAELASTFGEMLVFENLVAKSSTEEKLALYADKIEETFATIFRQISMYRFEQELHKARREMGELTTDEIGDLWQKNIQAMFLDSVEMGEEHKYWWMYVNHFVGTPFYVYAYSFGELLVMALYSMWKREGDSFVPKYEALLRAGGSCSPEELLSRVGINIKDPNFWRGGMAVVEKLIADFEVLYADYKASK